VEPKHWLKTAIMVAALIPGLIVGLVAKAIALGDRTIRKDIQVAVDYRETQVAIQTADQSLIAPYKEITAASKQFYRHLEANWEKKADIWKEEETQKKFSELFTKQAAFMDLLFTELSRVAKNDPKRMAEILSMQPHSYASEPLFAYFYFIDSLWGSYDNARNLLTHKGPNNQYGPRYAYHRELLTAESEAPFFSEGTLQSGWRKLYNEKAAKLDELRPTADGTMQSIRYFIALRLDGIDSRCAAKVDDTPLAGAANCFVTLPGCPSMNRPARLKEIR
jgi:hypothetical protein